MKLNNESKELLAFFAITAVIIAIFSAFYFGLAGLKIFIGMLMASAPFYIFLNTFSLAEGEKFILSLIFGITLFPSFVYLLGFFVSFRMSIALSFIIFIGIAFLFRYLKNKNHKN